MRSLFLALCLISLGFLPLIHGQQLSVTGLGGFTMARVVSGWSFAYQLLRPEVPDCRKISDSSSQLSVSWAGSTSSAAITGVQSGALDFGGIVTVLNSAQRAFVRDLLISGYSHAQGIRQYPITTSQVSVLYNLPLSYLPTDALNLTRAAVCGIFTGQVTQWDDPVILNANPAINPLDVSGKNITVRLLHPILKK